MKNKNFTDKIEFQRFSKYLRIIIIVFFICHPSVAQDPLYLGQNRDTGPKRFYRRSVVTSTVSISFSWYRKVLYNLAFMSPQELPEQGGTQHWTTFGIAVTGFEIRMCSFSQTSCPNKVLTAAEERRNESIPFQRSFIRNEIQRVSSTP